MTASTPHRADNGLSAAAFVGLVDVTVEAIDPLLQALGRARIAAYVDDPPPAAQPEGPAPEPRGRLYVAAEDRADARSVVVSAARVLAPGSVRSLGDALPSHLVENRFAELVGDWHVDTVAAIRAAERDLTREDADWRATLAPSSESPAQTTAPPTPDAPDAGATGADQPDAGIDDHDDEHYTPPAAPPLPRLSAATVFALLILAGAIFLLVAGGWIGLPGDLSFLLGVAGVLISAGLLVMRLRAHPEEPDDDGAVV